MHSKMTNSALIEPKWFYYSNEQYLVKLYSVKQNHKVYMSVRYSCIKWYLITGEQKDKLAETELWDRFIKFIVCYAYGE